MTAALMSVANFIHALKEYEEQHGASLEGLTITDEKVTFTGSRLHRIMTT